MKALSYVEIDVDRCSLVYGVGPCTASVGVTGEHKGWLRGPAGTNFNLYLIRSDGASWYVVASSMGSNSSEDLTYVGPPGTYTWRVLSFSGSGSYDFWMKQP